MQLAIFVKQMSLTVNCRRRYAADLRTDSNLNRSVCIKGCHA